MTTSDSDPNFEPPPYTDDDFDPGWEDEDQFKQLLPLEVDESELLDHRPFVPAPVSEFEGHSEGESGGEASEPFESGSDEVVRHHPEIGIRASVRIKSAEELLEKYRADNAHLFEKHEEPEKKLSAEELSRIRAVNSPPVDEFQKQFERDQEWHRSMSVDQGHHYIRDEINLRDDAGAIWDRQDTFNAFFRSQTEKSFAYKHPFATLFIPFCGIVFVCAIPFIWLLFWLMGG